jgi:UDP-N-acetylglucosamine--N-acetylmuramyl-(pentapeptide) pyrophosphoryl-undecaprenol N-acetylglucosamine transferase
VTFLIAAAGTGGHVYPGLAVGEALVEGGVSPREILFVGGDRLESKVYPDRGFAFVRVDLRGLSRSLSMKNLTLPLVMRKAARRIGDVIGERSVKVALGMGGYVTVPTAMAARRERIVLMVSEQNAGAGLANRLAGRLAERQFIAFPEVRGLPRGEWVGNPVRKPFSEFNRTRLRAAAIDRYGLDPTIPVIGVFGGSLGAGAINAAVENLVSGWTGSPVQVLHLTGDRDFDRLNGLTGGGVQTWVRVRWEPEMEYFYAVSDLVVARSGGGVAELTATGTPSVLIPGTFGSSGHQLANARFLEESGAAIVIDEAEIESLPAVVDRLARDRKRLGDMGSSAVSISKPDAASSIAAAMIEAA